MHKYIKIAPDPDAKPCRCGDGNPDCEHFEFCPECGEEYKAHEGHDCLDGFAVAQVGTAKELRDAAKELRDSLDACETERDRLRAELDAAHDGEDALRSEVARLRAQVAALQSVPQGVEVPDRAAWLTIEEMANCIVTAFPNTSRLAALAFANVVANASIAKGSRLVPTPPQADAVVALTDDIIRREWCNLHSGVEGDPDESAYSAFEAGVWQGYSLGAQPEERRVGADEVVVGREEWEAVQEFADLIVPIRDNLSGISWIGKLSDVFAAYDRWYAVRISAQAHNGEESNNVG